VSAACLAAEGSKPPSAGQTEGDGGLPDRCPPLEREGGAGSRASLSRCPSSSA